MNPNTAAIPAEASAEAFQMLKPVCSTLLQLRNSPHELTAALRVLHSTLLTAPAAGLPRCFDYVMYPLLFMLEASAAVRCAGSTKDANSAAASAQQQHCPSIAVPAMLHDSCAEAVLKCVLLLLERCKGSEPDQLLPVLKHVGALLQLPHSSVPEEMKLLCFSTVQAAVSSQQQQQQMLHTPVGHVLVGYLMSTCISAADAEVAAGPTGSKLVRQAAVQTLATIVTTVGPGPQLAFALPGLASGLSQQLLVSVPSATAAATTGAAAGSSGTVLLLRTLASVITLTLSDTVIASLPDCATPAPDASSPQQGHFLPQGDSVAVTTAHDALAALQRLSIQTGSSNDRGNAADAAVSCASAADITSSSSPSKSGRPAQQGPQNLQGATSKACSSMQPLLVSQDAAWLAQSSSKVQTLMAMVLPRLLTHSHPAVRRAVAEVVSDLLRCCSRAFSNSRVALTEVLLTLVNDDYSEVAQAAMRGLHSVGDVTKNAEGPAGLALVAADKEHETLAAGTASRSPPKPLQLADVAARLRRAAGNKPDSGPPPIPDTSPTCQTAPAGQNGQQQLQAPLLQDLLVDVCVQLHKSFQHSEASGIAAAKRASAALLCAEPQLVTAALLQKPLVLQQLCAALVETFAMDPTGASLLLRADVSLLGEVPTPAAAPCRTNSSSSAIQGDKAAPQRAQDEGTTPAHVSSQALREACKGLKSGRLPGGTKPLVPRMPLSMQTLVSTDSYKAAAGVARALGRMARQSDLLVQQPGHDHLQLVVQQLLDMLTAAASPHKQQQQHSWTPAAGSSNFSSLRPTPAAGQWQCNAAAVVAVLTEVVFGASAVWQPSLPLSDLRKCGSASATSDSPTAATALQSIRKAPHHLQQQQDCPGDAGFQSVLLQVVSRMVNPRLWSLPTTQPAEADGSFDTSIHHSKGRIPAQVLGANALLLRGLIDCVGTAARCAGPAFSTGSSKLLRTVLLPLLERLSDPCPMVSAAAAGALDSICLHTGYPGGLSQLVGANADYVVDGVCKQLRSLPKHPRAPQLLAALLREAGVGAALMPLLAEPLRAALSGLSIIGRQQQPGYILPFLYILQYAAGGADQEARHCQEVFSEQMQQASAAACSIIAGRQANDLWEDKGTSDTEHCGSTAAPPPPPATAAATAAGTPALHNSDDVPVLRDEEKLQLSSMELEHLELTWQRTHSAASLAAAAADAATPLLLQRNLRCAVLAVQSLTSALHALATASQALETEELLFDRLIGRGPDAALKPTRPTPAKLLPVVHTVWPLLLAALQDTGSVSLLEQQLSLLGQLMQLAGGKFMARRFRDNAWPLLQRLLKSGPQAGALALASSTAASTVGAGRAAAVLLGVGSGPGSDSRDPLRLPGAAAAKSSDSSVFGSALSSMKALAGASNTLNTAADLLAPGSTAADHEGPLAPATLQRVQLAVLGCLASIAGCKKSAPALHGGLVWDMCVMAAPFLADSQALTLREAAAKLLLAAAEVDADAVWLLLLDLAGRDQDAVGLISMSSLGDAAMGAHQHGKAEGLAPVTTEPASLPSLQKLLCPVSKGLSTGSGGPGDGGWCRLLASSEAAACGRRAAKLLPLAAAAPVAWHDRAAEQLRVLKNVSSIA